MNIGNGGETPQKIFEPHLKSPNVHTQEYFSDKPFIQILDLTMSILFFKNSCVFPSIFPILGS
jgi:hypothetical protein